MTIKRGTEAIVVMQIDGYKKPVLMIQNGCVIRKVASFNNQDEADRFSELLRRWLGLEKETRDAAL